MNFEKNNSSLSGIKVLVAPLDWGLGHATRCIPIICELQQLGATVYVAAEGRIRELLEKELKQIVFLPLQGYNIRYSKSRHLLPLTLLFQLPKFLLGVHKENKWLKKAVKQYGFDAVISDNRPGLYHAAVPCIYITHQLTIKTGFAFTEWLAQRMHYHFINKFSACWVPDNFEKYILAGDLSHPKKLPRPPLHYPGPLSRFEKTEAEKKYKLLILLSGPEPQRTVFENILLAELEFFRETVLFVRGLPGDVAVLTLQNKNIEVYNHLPAADLCIAIQQAEMVICRSGYTSVMDLIALQQKAILVPTPGQTEQEYLGEYLMKQKLFVCTPQHKFSLSGAQQLADGFPFSIINIDSHLYKKTIQEFFCNLKKEA